MGEWACEQSAVTRAERMTAWLFWSDMNNHVKLYEGAVESIELDGPFVTGASGRTVTSDFQQDWQLTDVVEGRHFGITGFTPDAEGTLSFSWDFEDQGDGTRITYRIRARGPDVDQYREVFGDLEANAPKGLAALIDALDRLAPE